MIGYNPSAMPADKMVRLFIIQAITSFVTNDFEAGLHYLNEIKTSYAEFMTQLSPQLKTLVKEIIQALDMFDPGSSSDSFRQVNQPQASAEETHFHSPQQEMSARMHEASAPAEQEISDAPQQTGTQSESVTQDLQELLARRKARRQSRD